MKEGCMNGCMTERVSLLPLNSPDGAILLRIVLYSPDRPSYDAMSRGESRTV
jgi:hypothetical protein